MTHNAVARRLRDGIRVAAFEPEVPTLDNVVRDNWSTTRGSMGCRSEPRATGRVTGTVLGRNLAPRSSDDWIDVESPLTTLTRNLALHNSDLGIEAVPGVTDGGGNRARGNSNPAQCTGGRLSLKPVCSRGRPEIDSASRAIGARRRCRCGR